MPFLSPEKIQTIKENTGGDRRYLKLNKLPDGKAAKFRFIGEGITGYVAWTVDNKPLRWEVLPEVLPENIRKNDDGERSARFFIAGTVWDYDAGMFRVVEITQKGLLSDLNKYLADEDYGDPCNWDFQITKTGSGLDTKYETVVKPPSDFAKKQPAAAKEFATLGWDLHRLFDGKHPWATDENATEEEATAA